MSVDRLLTLGVLGALFMLSSATDPNVTDSGMMGCPLVNCVGCPDYLTYALLENECQTCTCVNARPCLSHNCTDGNVCRMVELDCDTEPCDIVPKCVADPCDDWVVSCDSGQSVSCDSGQRPALTPYGCQLCWCVPDWPTDCAWTLKRIGCGIWLHVTLVITTLLVVLVD